MSYFQSYASASHSSQLAEVQRALNDISQFVPQDLKAKMPGLLMCGDQSTGETSVLRALSSKSWLMLPSSCSLNFQHKPHLALSGQRRTCPQTTRWRRAARCSWSCTPAPVTRLSTRLSAPGPRAVSWSRSSWRRWTAWQTSSGRHRFSWQGLAWKLWKTRSAWSSMRTTLLCSLCCCAACCQTAPVLSLSVCMQNLTLIDLPGITQMKAGGQSENVPKVTQKIVKKYMEGKDVLVAAAMSCCDSINSDSCKSAGDAKVICCVLPAERNIATNIALKVGLCTASCPPGSNSPQIFHACHQQPCAERYLSAVCQRARPSRLAYHRRHHQA